MAITLIAKTLTLVLGLTPGTPASFAPQRPAQEPRIAIVDVNVIPMDRETVLPRHTVLVEGARILSVGPSEQVTIPEGAKRVDGRGKYLIPGLVDMHVHFGGPEDEDLLLLHLAGGVTTVQSMHGSPFHLELRERLAKGMLGPRMFTTGPTTARERTHTPAEAVELVNRQKAAGYDAIKMYGDGTDTMSWETYQTLIRTAHQQGLRVVGHAPRNLPFAAVLDAGQDSIDHMEEVVYTSKPIQEQMGSLVRLQFSSGQPAEIERQLASLDDLVERLQPAARALAAEASRAGLVFTPTLITFETIWRQTTPEYSQMLTADAMQRIHPVMRAKWGPARNRYRTGSWRDRLPIMSQVLEKSFEVQRLLVRELHRAGVPVLAGTDAPLTFVHPGVSLHRELVLFVGCGLSPFDALRAATLAPARELEIESEQGTVASGKIANLVLLEENPLDDIRHVSSIAGVFRNGRWLPKQELDELVRRITSRYEPLVADVARIAGFLEDRHLADAFDAYYEVEVDDPALDEFLEFECNEIGYEFLGNRDFDAAFEAFELNCDSFPESSNAWDSLAEAHLVAGNMDLALRYYRKVLEVDPDHRNAQKQVREIQENRKH